MISIREARFALPLAAATLLSGCGAMTVDPGVRALEEGAQPTGSEFAQALADEYEELAGFEYREAFDYPDAAYWATKGMSAAEGNEVPPEDPGNWNIDRQSSIQELQSARSRLLSALDGNGRTSKPQVAARAQGFYDCWVEEQEEGWQLHNIEYCQRGFLAAMEELERRPAAVQAPVEEPEPRTEAQPVLTRSFLVFFDWDEAEVTPEAQQVLQAAASNADRLSATRILLTGHADRSGPAAYNEGLSLRRAENVKDALVRMGIPENEISVTALGEREPLVPTPDGVREPQNRRVEIVLQ